MSVRYDSDGRVDYLETKGRRWRYLYERGRWKTHRLDPGDPGGFDEIEELGFSDGENPCADGFRDASETRFGCFGGGGSGGTAENCTFTVTGSPSSALTMDPIQFGASVFG